MQLCCLTLTEMLGSNEVLVKNTYYTCISFSEDVSTVRNYFCRTKMKPLPVREDESIKYKKRMLKHYKKCVLYKPNTNMLWSQRAL